jgi:hypothetical protein
MLNRRDGGTTMLHVSLRADTRSQVATALARAALTAIERQVVGLSLHDRLATVLPTGRLQHLLHRAFGICSANRLADPRLELLRAFCVRYRVEGQAAFFRMSREASSVRLSSETMLAAAMLVDSWADFDLRIR